MDPTPLESLAPARCALVGHTGFVGSNLLEQFAFGATFNSKNIEGLVGRELDLIVCTAVSAVKWEANQNPDADWRRIQVLLEVLKTVQANRFILISTVDVYPIPRLVNEDVDPSQLSNHPYGQHRLNVEQFVASRFPVHHIIRLPGLFGKGLKKNVIFDLLNGKRLEHVNPASTFQYYDLGRLWGDLNRAVAAELALLNLTTEPIRTVTILERFFPNYGVGSQPAQESHYSCRSRHATLWGGEDGYLYSADTVLDDLARYLETHPLWQQAAV